MKNDAVPFAGMGCCLAMAVFLSPGCGKGPGKAPKEPVAVTVFQPAEKTDVEDYIYFTGHARPVQVVDVKPRVSGYLNNIAFETGGVVRGPTFKPGRLDTVEPESVVAFVGELATVPIAATLSPCFRLCLDLVEGDVLFEIDPRPYQATYDQVVSQVKLAEAKFVSAREIYKLNKEAVDRGKEIEKKTGDKIVVISPQSLVTYYANMVEAEAGWKAAQATLESASLDLRFTKVRAPVSGRITYNYLTRGNLVTKDQTSLARITSQNPMYVYFDVDEPTVQELQILHRQDPSTHLLNTPVWAGLSKDKDRYPLQGVLDYVDPEVDPTMGSKTFRAVFRTTPADYMRGGNFVRVKLSKGKPPYPAPVVPERALVAEQGNKYLLVTDANKKVRKEAVRLGTPLDHGLRVILPPEKIAMSDQAWSQRWIKEWVVLDGVGEALDTQDKGVNVIKRFRLALDTGSLQEQKDAPAK